MRRTEHVVVPTGANPQSDGEELKSAWDSEPQKTTEERENFKSRYGYLFECYRPKSFWYRWIYLKKIDHLCMIGHRHNSLMVCYHDDIVIRYDSYL